MYRRGSSPLRSIGIALGAAVVLNAVPVAAQPAGVANDPVGRAQPTRLAYTASGICAGGYQVVGTKLCTHGSDPAPEAIRDRGGPRPVSTAVAQAASAVTCDGDGESGKRVQALYVYVAGRENRRSTYVSSFRSWAANVDAMFEASAAETGGQRRVRWVTSGDCLLVVPAVALSAVAESDFGAMISELAALGYNRNDRKYLVWFDSDPRNSSYCGIGTVYVDDRPTANNNDALTGYARADFLCWNWSEAHELMHTLGAVQPSAPHATSALHCADEYDHMCYEDAATSVMSYICPERYEQLFDCGHDDYFSTSPAPDSYLATHWNTADSGWLVTDPVDLTPPVAERPEVSLLPGVTLTTTTRVGLEWPAASDDSGIAEYELQRRKGSGSWVAVPLPSPTATSVQLDLAVGATYTFRLRARDRAGNVGGWATTSPGTLTLLQEKSTQLVYTSGFKRVALSGASGGYVRKGTAAGVTATLTFSATDVAFVSTLGPARGIASIRLNDGLWQSFDFYDTATKTRQISWSAAASDGTHTVEVMVSGARNASATSTRIDVDAFLLWGPV